MRILFCDSGFNPKEIDYMYQEEYAAAKAANLSCSLISFEALKKGNLDVALRFVRPVSENSSSLIFYFFTKKNKKAHLY